MKEVYDFFSYAWFDLVRVIKWNDIRRIKPTKQPLINTRKIVVHDVFRIPHFLIGSSLNALAGWPGWLAWMCVCMWVREPPRCLLLSATVFAETWRDRDSLVLRFFFFFSITSSVVVVSLLQALRGRARNPYMALFILSNSSCIHSRFFLFICNNKIWYA